MDPRCLVVCPDQEAAGLLMLILSEIGMAAEHTTSITRGLELLDSQHYDAIVFDYRADPTSDEFMGRLRHSGNYRASLLIAVVASNFSARPLFGLGANFVLYRPLSSERTRISLRAARGLMRRERRRAPRALVSAPVTVAYPGMPEMKAFLTDLSDSGASIHSVNLPRACRVISSSNFPDTTIWCACLGRWPGKTQPAAPASGSSTCPLLRAALFRLGCTEIRRTCPRLRCPDCRKKRRWRHRLARFP